MKFQSTVSWFAAIAAAAGTAVAATPHTDAQGLRSMSGGVGEAEAQQMRQASGDYSLGLTFASRDGHFLAGVDVEVKDRTGRVVYSGTAQGPIVLVDLPQGRYTVDATFEGKTLRQGVTLREGRSRSVTLNWPFQDDVAVSSNRAAPTR